MKRYRLIQYLYDLQFALFYEISIINLWFRCMLWQEINWIFPNKIMTWWYKPNEILIKIFWVKWIFRYQINHRCFDEMADSIKTERFVTQRHFVFTTRKTISDICICCMGNLPSFFAPGIWFCWSINSVSNDTFVTFQIHVR